jgi:MFS family permease
MLAVCVGIGVINYSSGYSMWVRSTISTCTAALIMVESGFTPAALVWLTGALGSQTGRGTAMGAYSVMLGVGTIVGSLLAAALAPRFAVDGLLAATFAMALLACIADAQEADRYAAYLRGAGFTSIHVEPHYEALVEMAAQIRMRLLGAEIMVGLKKVNLPGVDFVKAKELLKASLEAIHSGQLGYAILTASRPT